ncbi:MAG: hypothetical protein ACFFDR_00315 [Candidatus Thorarchaeota archaeon]
MNERKPETPNQEIRSAAQKARRALREPMLKILLERSLLTDIQMETLLIDLAIEDQVGDHIPYEDKASIRRKSTSKSSGVSRGAFNRSLSQARRNVTRCLYTMLLLAYLGLFDYTIFRPFEELSSKIGGYQNIREVLSGRENLTTEDLESYRAAEQTIMEALEELASPLILKSELSRKKQNTDE